jgi:sialidase-1
MKPTSSTPLPPVREWRRREFIKALAVGAASVPSLRAAAGVPPAAGLRKIEDRVIYRNPLFYCMTPSVITRPDGEVIVAFRRAPERRAYGEKSSGHTDSKAHLVLVRSRDGGQTWSQKPELLYAHPMGGSQDPCMVQLRDGGLVCTSYAWLRLNPGALVRQPPVFTSRAGGEYNFLGGYLLRSADAAKPPPRRLRR